MLISNLMNEDIRAPFVAMDRWSFPE